jgi:hypothetical protein
VEDFQLLSSPAVAAKSCRPAASRIRASTRAAPSRPRRLRRVRPGRRDRDGLYLLRSINSQGEEGDDFPKFTGGWIFAVPAIGDADLDGKLDIATMTREGFAFVWNTGQPACGGNEEWWTSRHDEWYTGAYGTDTRPPGVPEKLKAKRAGDPAELTWKAPGDDHLCGQAERYRILASRKPIDGPDDGEAVGSDTDASDEPGDEVSVTVDLPQGTRFVAVLYQDDAATGGWSAGRRRCSRNAPVGRARDRDAATAPSSAGSM